ncbi:MAG TPA: hypothetical protein DCX19_04470, partial [Alphaproteobacteria bacterium]|nr:hypothetical protein [Alphaproteobacteria bacterium]
HQPTYSAAAAKTAAAIRIVVPRAEKARIRPIPFTNGKGVLIFLFLDESAVLLPFKGFADAFLFDFAGIVAESLTFC